MLGKYALRTFVSRLSVDLGCTEVDETLFDDVPWTVDDFTNAVLQAEGFTPGVGGGIWRDARRVVDEVFDKYFVAD